MIPLITTYQPYDWRHNMSHSSTSNSMMGWLSTMNTFYPSHAPQTLPASQSCHLAWFVALFWYIFTKKRILVALWSIGTDKARGTKSALEEEIIHDKNNELATAHDPWIMVYTPTQLALYLDTVMCPTTVVSGNDGRFGSYALPEPAWAPFEEMDHGALVHLGHQTGMSWILPKEDGDCHVWFFFRMMDLWKHFWVLINMYRDSSLSNSHIFEISNTLTVFVSYCRHQSRRFIIIILQDMKIKTKLPDMTSHISESKHH